VKPNKFRIVALFTILALVASACGARLNDQQRTAVRAAQQGRATNTPFGAGSGTGSGDEGSTDTTLAAGDTGNSGGGSTRTTSASSGGGGQTGAGVNVHAMPPGGNGGATDVGVTGNSVSLGNVSTLTGPVPGLFAGAVVGAQAVVAYENSLGGLWGRQFKLDARDDQFDTGQNKSQTDDLITKAFAMLGSFSLYDDAAANDMKAANIPDVGHSLGQGRFQIPNNFSIQPSAPGGPTSYFNYFKNRNPNGIKSVGTLYSDIPSATALQQGFEAAAKSVGYQFTYRRAVGATETDFTSDVVRMRDTGVRLVFLVSLDDKSIARVAKAMKSQGYKPDAFVVGTSGSDADVPALAGDAIEGMFVVTSTTLFGGEDSSVVPEVALFNKWVQKVKPGFVPDIFAAYAWASGRLLFQAMENAGPKPTRAAIDDAIRKIGAFDSNGFFAESNPGAKKPAPCFILAKVTAGKYVRSDSPKAGFRCGDGGWFTP
jgi:ABC-type branched-subunit amino acid transport system substrate-binding protein